MTFRHWRALISLLLFITCTAHIFTVVILGDEFAWTDNVVVVICAYFGSDLGTKFGNASIGAALGGGIGNTMSDVAGALIDSSMGASWVPGIIYGCLVPLLLIPSLQLLTEYRANRRNRTLAKIEEEVKERYRQQKALEADDGPRIMEGLIDDGYVDDGLVYACTKDELLKDLTDLELLEDRTDEEMLYGKEE